MGQIVKGLSDLTSFFIPKYSKENDLFYSCYNKDVAVVIPTYNPQLTTVQIVGSWLCYVPRVQVIVVDDSTPEEKKDPEVYRHLNKLDETFDRVHFIKSPRNLYRAGAVNIGLEYIKTNLQDSLPDVVVACDDDTYITDQTMNLLLQGLYQYKDTGAVCSQARIQNKNKNLLTRLQGLEYHGFNITRQSDNGLYQGPLVMHGLLSAYRYEAIAKVGGFTPKHLIEDYDLTVRLKRNGWQVRMVPDAAAWTDVPESLSILWKQRVRWYCGGLKVLTDYYQSFSAIVQDLIGHFTFITMLILIGVSFFAKHTSPDQQAILWLFAMGLVQFALSFGFNLITLNLYKDGDVWDWMIRLSIIPEFIYGNLMALILIGSYLYYGFVSSFGRLQAKVLPARFIYQMGNKIFSLLGYSLTWGTK